MDTLEQLVIPPTAFQEQMVLKEILAKMGNLGVTGKMLVFLSIPYSIVCIFSSHLVHFGTCIKPSSNTSKRHLV